MIIHRQRGFTLLELMAALAIGMLMLLGLTAMLDMSLQDVKGQQAGQYQAQFVAAATRYLGDQYGVLLPPATGVLTKTTVSLTDLQAAGLLSASFAATNSYNQAPCMLLRSPAAGQIDALIVTEGGNDIPEADISYLAANAGAGGGAITYDIPGDDTSATVARGAHGGWALTTAQLNQFITGNTCSGTPAGLWRLASALFFGGAGQVQNDFLYRSPVNGDASFNRMNTPIGMGGAALVAAGDSCGPLPAVPSIAMTATGSLLTCDIASNKFTDPSASQWKPPVADYAELLALPLPAQGDVRIAKDNGRAYMWKGLTIATGQWLALALNNTGDLPMEGKLTMNGGNLDMNGGNLTLTGVPLALPATGVVPGTGDLTMAGNLIADGRIVGKSGVVSDAYIGGHTLSFYGTFTLADTCNYRGPYDPVARGFPLILPAGTVVMDDQQRPMVCHADSTTIDAESGHFVYLNNTTTPPTYVP